MSIGVQENDGVKTAIVTEVNRSILGKLSLVDGATPKSIAMDDYNIKSVDPFNTKAQAISESLFQNQIIASKNQADRKYANLVDHAVLSSPAMEERIQDNLFVGNMAATMILKQFAAQKKPAPQVLGATANLASTEYGVINMTLDKANEVNLRSNPSFKGQYYDTPEVNKANYTITPFIENQSESNNVNEPVIPTHAPAMTADFNAKDQVSSLEAHRTVPNNFTDKTKEIAQRLQNGFESTTQGDHVNLLNVIKTAYVDDDYKSRVAPLGGILSSKFQEAVQQIAEITGVPVVANDTVENNLKNMLDPSKSKTNSLELTDTQLSSIQSLARDITEIQEKYQSNFVQYTNDVLNEVLDAQTNSLKSDQKASDLFIHLNEETKTVFNFAENELEQMGSQSNMLKSVLSGINQNLPMAEISEHLTKTTANDEKMHTQTKQLSELGKNSEYLANFGKFDVNFEQIKNGQKIAESRNDIKPKSNDYDSPMP